MMQRSRANEIPELVRSLGSRSRSRVDAARARLSIIGARAVEQLIDALEGDNNRIRAHAMPLLSLIQDSRAREPLVAMLLDRDSRMREIAVRCLARFPATDVVAALNRLLKRDPEPTVRIAAVHSLVEQSAAGQEQAIGRLLALLLDSRESVPIRLEAFALLRMLRPAQRRAILARLGEDSDEQIRTRAEEASRDGEHGAGEGSGVPRLLGELAASDYPTWDRAVQRLRACGSAVIEPLVREMRSRSHDPEYCARAGMVLKALGPRRGRGLADALEELEEPLPLQVLVEVIGARGEKSLIYRLKDLIGRLGRLAAPASGNDGFDPLRPVRAKAHLELARIGSRVAIQDLRAALEDRGPRLELELLAAVELIGKREELGTLLEVYGREDGFMRDRIAHTVREIMRRERIRRTSRIFQSLGERQRRALEEILPRPRVRPRRTERRVEPRA